MMNQETHIPKRKRGRPCKRKISTPKADMNLVGKKLTGEIEGSFDAGYFINVKVEDSDIILRGLVFIPDKVTPITPGNDVAPLVQMCEREEIKKTQSDESLLNDQPTKDAAPTDLEMSDSGQALALVPPQESNGDFTVPTKEDMKDEDTEAATLLVEFYQFHKTTEILSCDQNSTTINCH